MDVFAFSTRASACGEKVEGGDGTQARGESRVRVRRGDVVARGPAVGPGFEDVVLAADRCGVVAPIELREPAMTSWVSGPRRIRC